MVQNEIQNWLLPGVNKMKNSHSCHGTILLDFWYDILWYDVWGHFLKWLDYEVCYDWKALIQLIGFLKTNNQKQDLRMRIYNKPTFMEVEPG